MQKITAIKIPYSAYQQSAIDKSLNMRLNFEQMDIILNPDLPSWQMDEVRYAIQDGITDIEKLKILGTLGLYAWQNHLLRLGFANNIDMNFLTELVGINISYNQGTQIQIKNIYTKNSAIDNPMLVTNKRNILNDRIKAK